jgi:hypothetical protein
VTVQLGNRNRCRAMNWHAPTAGQRSSSGKRDCARPKPSADYRQHWNAEKARWHHEVSIRTGGTAGEQCFGS